MDNRLIDRLERNRSALAEVGAQFPHLNLLFTKKSPELRYRLEDFYVYIEKYIQDGGYVSYDLERGVEVPAALMVLSAKLGHTEKTWHNTLKKLAYYGLIVIHKPNGKRRENTPPQDLSNDRANKDQGKDQ